MNGKYVTISLPKAITEAIDELIDELGYWPSRGSFIREAREEPVKGGKPASREGEEDDPD